MGFIKFLFIAILVLWILRMLTARLLPWILRGFAKKMQEQAFKEYQAQGQQRSRQNPREHQKKTEGKINIDYIPPQPPNQNGANQAGEFVDFEEIK